MERLTIDPTTPVYPLRIAAKISNTSIYSLRQYIDQGLLFPHKTKTGRHLFTQIDVLRIQLIRKELDENGLNFAGIKRLLAQIPCWLIKPCSEKDYSNCDAYTSSIEPCWQVTVKGPQCKETECRTCEVYRLVEKYDDIKTIFKEYFKPKKRES